jgi:hypothetical protein
MIRKTNSIERIPEKLRVDVVIVAAFLDLHLSDDLEPVRSAATLVGVDGGGLPKKGVLSCPLL